MGTDPTPSLLWAPQAWLRDGWHTDVLLRTGPDGCWAEVTPGVVTPPEGAIRLNGPVLPGLVNAHSHAFQRAFAGLAEQRHSDADDFWSWRERMYGVASRITPEQLRAIAAQLYVELLRGGYTQVCEFHYLQHAPGGSPYADPHTLSWALADAAADAGMGLTLLPVLYERAGFTQPALRDDQRRFRTTATDVWTACHAVQRSGRPLLNAGVAVHSLRAAAPESIKALRTLADGMAGPIHIHAAEQMAEVNDCLAATGARPIEWLAREGLLDPRWQLVHATHSTPSEIESVAASGAGAVICPSTEGNLGDGLCDLPGWLNAGVPLSLGSDSHVTRAWPEELRWLEYGQRLQRRQRNVSAAPAQGTASTAQRLWSRMQAGGAAAAGFTAWGLAQGARADALVLDMSDASLLGIPMPQALDAVVFSSPGQPFRDVMVAGRWAIRNGWSASQEGIASRFDAAMSLLWATA
jgi:formimidoylglutamate deiminase